MDSPPRSPDAAPQRGRLACVSRGAAYFLAGLLGPGLAGAFVALIAAGFKESWSYVWYESQSMVPMAAVAGALLGAWMGWKSFRPAALAAQGQLPKPPFFTRLVTRARRAELAVLSTYAAPRWELLTGLTEKPWRMMPRVLAGLIAVAAVVLPMSLGRDNDFRLSFGVCGALGLLIADCFLVNTIAGWRRSGQLAPV